MPYTVLIFREEITHLQLLSNKHSLKETMINAEKPEGCNQPQTTAQFFKHFQVCLTI